MSKNETQKLTTLADYLPSIIAAIEAEPSGWEGNYELDYYMKVIHGVTVTLWADRLEIDNELVPERHWGINSGQQPQEWLAKQFERIQDQDQDLPLLATLRYAWKD